MEKKILDKSLKEGMIFTVEPMINLGKFETKTLKRWMDCSYKR